GAVEPREFEFKYSEQFAQRAVEWIQHNPGTFIGLALKKAVLIWVADPYHWSNIKYVYAFFQVIAFGLGLIGVLSLRRQLSSAPLEHWLWIAGAACSASTLITMVFFSLPRYQIFLVGIYFPMVALGAEDVLMRWLARRQKPNLPATEFAAN
ncbi:MAG TPA: hypothetical protein VFH43_14020, partial [Candidatus Kapabacteria bacterium]|nr:hypothetical protein [Candidatus Kapabacteria bacterium]